MRSAPTSAARIVSVVLSTTVLPAVFAGCQAFARFTDCQRDDQCPAGLVCSPVRRVCHLPVREVCGNAIDDDLDGVVDGDETFGPCEVENAPAGSCRHGELRCTGGTLACRASIERRAEICDNGIDDDCNGLVDDTSACMHEFASVGASAPMTLGTDDLAVSDPSDGPAHPVCLAGFSLDRHEVSVNAYVRFLNSLAPQRVRVGTVPAAGATPERGFVFVDDEAAVLLSDDLDALALVRHPVDGWQPADRRAISRNLPIVRVTYAGADAYCYWAGKHLPTEAEWWRAARGADGTRRFPWGDAPLDCTRANVGFGGPAGDPCRCNLAVVLGDAPQPGEACDGAPVGVDDLEAGRTPEGVHHLLGNVNEWIFDALDLTRDGATNRYYSRYPLDGWCRAYPQGPLGPATTGPIDHADGGAYCSTCRFARGRHFHRSTDARAWTRRWLDASNTDATIGFRCAMGGATR